MTMTDLVYHCAAGESFDSIALRLYGHEKYAEDLMQANPGYCGLAVFDGGETLALPPLSSPVSNTERAMANTIAPWKL